MFSSIRSATPVASTAIRSLAATSQNLQPFHSSKMQFSTSLGLKVREIKVNEQEPDKKTGKRNICVEGEVFDLPNNKFVVPTYSNANGCQNASEACHPLCRFDFVHEIKHTDVLILRQFMDNKGNPINRQITGLCKRQHTRVSKLIKMAAKAGLFPENLDMFNWEKKPRKGEREFAPALKLNAYWDESTIDIQQHQMDQRDKRNSFKK